MNRFFACVLAFLLVSACNDNPTPPPRDRPRPETPPRFEMLDAGMDGGALDGGADGGAEVPDGGDSHDAG